MTNRKLLDYSSVASSRRVYILIRLGAALRALMMIAFCLAWLSGSLAIGASALGGQSLTEALRPASKNRVGVLTFSAKGDLTNADAISVGMGRAEALRRLQKCRAKEVPKDVVPNGSGWMFANRAECLFLAFEGDIIIRIMVETNTDKPKMLRRTYEIKSYVLP